MWILIVLGVLLIVAAPLGAVFGVFAAGMDPAARPVMETVGWQWFAGCGFLGLLGICLIVAAVVRF